MACKK
ncbi:uncharacterized protein FFC1_06520 [Fusarium fujikuroi]